MKIKASCVYDYDAIKTVQRLNMYRKANPKYRLTMSLGLIALLFFILLAECIAFGFVPLLVILLVCDIFFCALLLYLYFLAPKIQIKTLNKRGKYENFYEFCEENVLLKYTSTCGSDNGETVIKYTDITKIRETKRYLLLSVGKFVYIVDKSTVSSEEMKALSGFLKGITDKYTVIDY
ncbi:MAG: YcxB family protein [Eubacteriales bacterium]|nr:YcxB family protein [Eubacteriales bacterium]